MLEVVGFLNSNERSKDKYKRLSMLFDEHSTKLEQRVATITDSQPKRFSYVDPSRRILLKMASPHMKVHCFMYDFHPFLFF